jgi:hypothetical protein
VHPCEMRWDHCYSHPDLRFAENQVLAIVLNGLPELQVQGTYAQLSGQDFDGSMLSNIFISRSSPGATISPILSLFLP